MDWAASANGGAASVSSTASSADYPAASLNDDAWLGSTWGHGDGWRAATKANEWAQVTFATAQTIHAVTLYSAPDGVVVDADGIDARTFTRVGVVEFDVQVSNGHGNNWKTVAHVSGNHLIKRSVSFAPVSAGAVRVICTSGGSEGIGLVELEAWGASGIGNVALPMASKNKDKTPAPTATIVADSASEELYPATAMVDGIVDGKDWGNAATGGWMSAGEGAFPTTVELAFEKPQVLDAVTLWTLQDDYEQGGEPTDSTTFTKWGLTAFDVQVWRNGWVTVAQITDNNLVKRTVTFAPTAAMRLRIVAKAGLAGAARIVELQAWGVEMTGLPRLTGLRPQQAAVGETVTLSGENFSRIATADRVLFNGIAGEVTQASATSLSVRIPPGATTGRLSLTINGIESKTGGDFTIAGVSTQTGNAVGRAAAASAVAAGTGPTIDNFSPAKGAPDTIVTIVGSGFDPNPANNTVQFGGTYANVVSASSTSLAVKAPSGDTGSISVTVGGNTAVSAGFYYYPPYGISFTPTSGPAELTNLTITGRNVWYSTVNFTGGVSSSSSPTVNNTIVTFVANGAQTGPITLTNWDMTSAPSTQSFTVTHPAPTITSFTPTSGKPGDVIQINGTNFSPTIANNVVKFNGVTATISDRSNVGTWLKAVVPMTATSGKISVTKDGQTATSSGTFTVNPLAAQAAAFIAQTPPPSTMIAGQTAAVSVTMQNIGSSTWTAGQLYRLGSQNGVDWGVGQRVALPNDVAYGQQVTFNFTITAPATPGSYNFVWQMLQDGVGWFGTIAPAAAVTVTPVTLSVGNVKPSAAKVGQSTTINGTGFSSTSSGNAVKFACASQAANQTATSSNALEVTVPPDACSGPITVRVGGQSVSTSAFSVVADITRFTPLNGPVGTQVTLTGTGFGATQSGAVVGIGGRPLAISSWSPTQIVATIPNGASSSQFGFADVANQFYYSVDPFTVTPPVPTVSTLSVTHGMVGDSVIFTGTNFSTAAGGNVVKFNGVASTTVTSMTSTKLTATVPLGATTGPVSVSVGVSTGNGPSFTVDPTPAATCSSAAAQAAVVATNATSQRIYAYGVQNASDVKFPTWWVEENNTNDLQWLQGINAGGGTWYADVPHSQYDPGNPRYGQFITRVFMTNPAYNNNASQQCSVDVWWVWQAPLTVTGQSLAASIGQSVVIGGSGFNTTPGSNSVRFKGASLDAQVTLASSTSLTVIVPANAMSGAITVTVGQNTVTTANGFFTLVPVLNSINPKTGPPGTSVTIGGSGFGATQRSASIGSSALSVGSWSDTTIVATIPQNAASAKLTVQTADGPVSSADTFTVTDPVPTVTGFDPTSGEVDKLVTITGTNFSVATNTNTVKFNGVPATTVTPVSATQLTARVPAGASTGPISVQVASATGASSSAFTVPALAAKFVSQNVPATMTAGQKYPNVAITMQNIGSSTWRAGQTIQLASTNGLDWGVGGKVSLSADTAPGQNATFQLTVTAPETPGPYAFLWQMQQDGGAAFGLTSLQNINVTPVPLVVYWIDGAGDTAGSKIILTGAGFSSTAADNAVTFTGNAARADVSEVNATKTQLTVTVPYPVTYGPITVKVGSQTVTTAGNFSPRPKITGFAPAGGGPGTRVTISGTNFYPVSDTVMLGDLRVPVMSWNETTIEVQIVRDVQSGPFTVTTSSRLSATSLQNFNYVAPPPTPLTITRVSPKRGSFLSFITIEGTGFSRVFGRNQVTFAGGAPVDDAKVEFVDSKTLRVPVPLAAVTGPITVKVDAQTAVSPQDFTVLPTPALDAQFLYQNPMTWAQMRNAAPKNTTIQASLTFRNTGSTTWTREQKFRLGALSIDWNWVDSRRVELPAPVAPGETVTFLFNAKTPPIAGVYNLQWQLVQDADSGAVWFGDRSDNVAISVGNPEDFPRPPVAVTAAYAGGGKIQIDWQAAQGGISPTSYLIAYRLRNDVPWSIVVDRVPLTPTSIKVDFAPSTYYIGVAACTDSLCSEYTSSGLVTVPPSEGASCAGLALTPDNVGFLASDTATTTRQINVDAPTGCYWSVDNSDAVGWLTATPTGGIGPGKITLAPKGANTTAKALKGTVKVIGKDASAALAVSQEAMNCNLTVLPTDIQLPAGGGLAEQKVAVKPMGCSWTVTSSVRDWLTVAPDHGTGDGSLGLTTTANALTTARTATLSILVIGLDPVTVNVTQLAVGSTATPPSMPTFGPPIDPAVTHDPTVGTMAGQAGTDGGAAQYHVPIVVPPGRAGMQPDLALVYNSRSGNGVVGMGWTISGLSSIHRCPRTPEQDGQTLGVTYADTDRLCLDGQRLVKVAKTKNDGTADTKNYGTQGTEYRTEVDSYARITQIGGDISGSDVACFRVEQKNGRILHYGGVTNGSSCSISSTASSRVKPTGAPAALSWLVEKIEDRVGNNQIYTYTNKGDGEVLLSNVAYTGYNATVGDRSVSFVYQPRTNAVSASNGSAVPTDISSSYLAGGLTMQTQALQSITTKVGTATVRTYTPTYAVSSYSQRLMMVSLKECASGSEGLVCHPETQFVSTEKDAGDAKPDFHLTSLAALKIPTAPQTPPSLSAAVMKAMTAKGMALAAPVAGDPNTDDPDDWIVSAGDMDGDGTAELAAHIGRGQTGKDYLVQLTADRQVRSAVEMTGKLCIAQSDCYGDFAGDGRSAAILLPRSSSDLGKVQLAVWNLKRGAIATGSEALQILPTNIPAFVPPPGIPQGIELDSVHVVDINGDGKLDIVKEQFAAAQANDCGNDQSGTPKRAVFAYLNQTEVNPLTGQMDASHPPKFSDGIQLSCLNREVKLPTLGDPTLYYITLDERISQITDFNGDGIPDIFIGNNYLAGDGDNGGAALSKILSMQVVNGVPSTKVALSCTQIGLVSSSGMDDECSRSTRYVIHWIDVNGDGLNDFVIARPNQGIWQVRLNTGGHLGPLITTSGNGRNAGLDNYNNPSQPYRYFFKYAGRLPQADIDGDGKPEVLVVSKQQGFALKMCVFYALPPTPNGECQTSETTTGPLPDQTAWMCPAYACPQDPSGDYHMPGPAPDGFSKWNKNVIFPMYGSNTGHDDVGYADASAYHLAAVKFVQLDATSIRADLVETSLVSTLSNPQSSPPNIDVFGDGLQDLVTRIGCPHARFELPLPNTTLRWDSCLIVDEPGYGPATVPTYASPTDASPSSVAASSFKYDSPIFINQNVGTGLRSVVSPLSVSTSTAGGLPGLLAKATNGLGDTAQWTYLPLAQPIAQDGISLYTIKNPLIDGDGGYADARHYYFTSSMPVVSAMTQSNGIGGTTGARSAVYGYSEAMYNHLGRGFQGFRTITVENAASDASQRLATTTTFKQKFPLVGKMDQVTTRTAATNGSRTIRTETAAYSCVQSDGSLASCPQSDSGTAPLTIPTAATVQRPVASTQASNDYDFGTGDLSGHSTTSNSEWDVYGNIKKQAVSRGDDASGGTFVDSHTTTTTNTYDYSKVSDWWLDKLDTTTAQAQVSYALAPPAGTDTGAKTLTTKYTWNDPNRTPATKTVQPGVANQESTTTYTYPASPAATNYGLPTAVQITGSGIDQARTTTYAYSSDGYFVASTKNGLGHEVKTTTRARDGQIESAIDPNSIIASTTYDAFGHAMQTTRSNAGGLIEPAINIATTPCAGGCTGSGSDANETLAAFRTVSTQAGYPTKVVWYDLLGRPVKQAQAGYSGIARNQLQYAFSATLTRYDENGRTWKQSTPYYVGADQPSYTEFAYDALNRVTSKEAPAACSGGKFDTTYAYVGRQTNITASGYCGSGGPNSSITMSRSTNVLGQLMQTVDANVKKTNYWPDALGHVAAIRDVENNVIQATYNALGHRLQSVDPDQGTWNFTYNALGELQTQTDARNVTTTVTGRDVLGRVTQRKQISPTDKAWVAAENLLDTWTYDPTNGVGQIATVSRRRGTESDPALSAEVWKEQYTYNDASRPMGIKTTIGEPGSTLSLFSATT
ncbi:MAG: IPT/TIG domain-containing protein, partial [Rudaea sp.]